MKTNLLVFALLVSITSCTSVKQIGKVNMISNRNVDTKLNYQAISTYSGGSKKELKKSRAVTIEDAVDKTVRKVAGGEFLMNAKIYLIDNIYIAVEGDVWGVASNVTFRGFKVGSKVTWETITGFKTGIIKSLKDDLTCLIELEDGSIIEKKYDSISKSE
jgi:hypothetical protein